MTHIAAELRSLGFETTLDVAGLNSIAGLFEPHSRCGIYVLHFANNEHYAGMAVDVARRYAHHCKRHLDIQKISFKQTEPHELRKVEKTVITSLEKAGFHLRNIEGTSQTYSPAPFDSEIMTPNDQLSWQRTLSWQDAMGERIEDVALRQKYHQRFRRFLTLPHADTVVSVLRTYVWTCIPAPRKTEKYFWSCTLPQVQNSDKMLIRVNINGQEVFTINVNNPSFGWHVSKSALRRVPWWIYGEDHKYETGGHDQVYIGVRGAARAHRVLKHPRAVAAMRLFNLRLMRKGPTRFYRYHVFDLADLLLE